MNWINWTDGINWINWINWTMRVSNLSENLNDEILRPARRPKSPVSSETRPQESCCSLSWPCWLCSSHHSALIHNPPTVPSVKYTATWNSHSILLHSILLFSAIQFHWSRLHTATRTALPLTLSPSHPARQWQPQPSPRPCSWRPQLRP